MTLVFSALFGDTTIDAIPAYRFLQPQTSGFGPMGACGGRLTDQMAGLATGPLLTVAPRPTGRFESPPLQTVTIDVFQRVNGGLGVPHWAKQARGYVSAIIAEHARSPISSLDQVAGGCGLLSRTHSPTNRKAASLRVLLNHSAHQIALVSGSTPVHWLVCF